MADEVANLKARVVALESMLRRLRPLAAVALNKADWDDRPGRLLTRAAKEYRQGGPPDPVLLEMENELFRKMSYPNERITQEIEVVLFGENEEVEK